MHNWIFPKVSFYKNVMNASLYASHTKKSLNVALSVHSSFCLLSKTEAFQLLNRTYTNGKIRKRREAFWLLGLKSTCILNQCFCYDIKVRPLVPLTSILEGLSLYWPACCSLGRHDASVNTWTRKGVCFEEILLGYDCLQKDTNQL